MGVVALSNKWDSSLVSENDISLVLTAISRSFSHDTNDELIDLWYSTTTSAYEQQQQKKVHRAN